MKTKQPPKMYGDRPLSPLPWRPELLKLVDTESGSQGRPWNLRADEEGEGRDAAGRDAGIWAGQLRRRREPLLKARK